MHLCKKYLFRREHDIFSWLFMDVSLLSILDICSYVLDCLFNSLKGLFLERCIQQSAQTTLLRTIQNELHIFFRTACAVWMIYREI